MLLVRARIDETRSISTGDGGQREWPRGFLGSLTHKGTVVLGIIAASSTVAMIGVDLDRRGPGRSELSAVQHIVAPEGLPAGTDPERGALLSFCAKEAVFKAQYPLTRRWLNFSDVRLAWARSGDNLRAEVISPVSGLIVRAAFVGDWVLAVAISSLKPPQ
jgi:4'-phosphopantetheinyl transferase EntD